MVKILTYKCEKMYHKEKKMFIFNPLNKDFYIEISNNNKFCLNIITKNSINLNTSDGISIVSKKNNKYINVNNKLKINNNNPDLFNDKKIFIKNFKIIKNTKINKNNISLKENDYYNKIEDFCVLYNSSIEEIKTNKKIEFRYFCFRYLKYISNLKLPKIKLNMKNEAVLIEYRNFPHIEFILRNNINKLGSEWSHTIICGILNYEYILKITDNISSNIKVIKTPYENLNQSTYSKFLSTIEFWNFFEGEKILIYQEDSIIFKSNINDFMHWDYIGAPWPKNQNDNINCVGNGGFSLRTKQCMIDVIKKISLENTIFESSTLNFMKNCKMVLGPEDVYFSLNMIRYNIGKVSDWDSAYKFSSESISNQNSFGGHNFWINDENWKKRLYNEIVIQFKPTYKTDDLEHRGGWKYVIKELKQNDLFNEKSEFIFFDLIERQFLWEKDYICEKKWGGIIHCTPNTPSYLNIINIKNLFENKNFIYSLDNCVFIISLSKYVSNYLNEEFKKIKKNIKIYTLFHPVFYDIKIEKFNFKKYVNNDNKYLIQIGQQLRKMTSIYLVNINKSYKKLWLTGTKNISKCIQLLKKEIIHFNLKLTNFYDIKMKYTNTFEEYDELLTKNIVLVDLFDASANNTILECIVRNTPILINKLPAVIEYLGDDYPLYFNNLNEINKLLSINNITLAHKYLKNMDKKKFELNYFTRKITSIIYENIEVINDKTIDEKNIYKIISNNKNISALIIRKNKKFEIIESYDKIEICRSIQVFENIKNIITEYDLDVVNDKVIYHYKSDACNYDGMLLPILSHSKKITNNNITLFPLTKIKSYIYWDLLEYIKTPDNIEWKNKQNIFFFRGLNSGNPFDCIEYPWFKNRSSRTKLLLESLKLPNKFSKLYDISFYNIENYDQIIDVVNDINKLSKLYDSMLKKNKTIEDLQNEIKIILNYVKPKIELKEIFIYKYIICPEGYDTSSQLNWVLASNSIAICPLFEYENNIINPCILKPYVHYIPIKSDYTDLQNVITWCLENDDKCKIINLNAKKYMEQFININKMKDFQKDIVLKII